MSDSILDTALGDDYGDRRQDSDSCMSGGQGSLYEYEPDNDYDNGDGEDNGSRRDSQSLVLRLPVSPMSTAGLPRALLNAPKFLPDLSQSAGLQVHPIISVSSIIPPGTSWPPNHQCHHHWHLHYSSSPSPPYHYSGGF